MKITNYIILLLILFAFSHCSTIENKKYDTLLRYGTDMFSVDFDQFSDLNLLVLDITCMDCGGKAFLQLLTEDSHYFINKPFTIIFIGQNENEDYAKLKEILGGNIMYYEDTKKKVERYAIGKGKVSLLVEVKDGTVSYYNGDDHANLRYLYKKIDAEKL